MLWRAAHRPPPESLAEARAASVSSAPLPPSASEPPPPIAPSAAAQIASAALASSAPPQAPPKAAAQAPRTPKREAEPQAPTAPAPAEPPGVLSFTTYPWTRVYEGGKLLGTTPLYRVSLSAGTHVLTLENPDEGVKTTYTVTIKSGESVTRSIALK
jgi:serine/threonine-protein kinase